MNISIEIEKNIKKLKVKIQRGYKYSKKENATTFACIIALTNAILFHNRANLGVYDGNRPPQCRK